MLPPNPSDIPAMYQRALALQKGGQSARALDIYQQILLARPKTAEAWFQIGRIHVVEGDQELAERALRRAMTLQPKEPAIWRTLYGILNGTAAKTLERAAQRAGIILGQKAEADPILRLIQTNPAKAEAQALTLVKAAPDAFWPAFALGRARAARANWAGALGPLEMAHKRAPTDRGAQLHLGLCLARLDQPLRAEVLLAPLVHKSPLARHGLARLYRENLRLAEALAMLDSDGAGGKSPHEGLFAVERALISAAGGQRAAALAALRAAVAAGGDKTALSHDLANTFEEAGDDEAALQTIEMALTDHPTNPGLLTQRALLHQTAGDFAAAEADLKTALTHDPTYAEAYRAYVAGRKVAVDDPILLALMAQIDRPGQTNTPRYVLHFAAAKAMDDTRRKDRVFDHLHRANRLMARAFPYNFDADLAEARRMVADWAVLVGAETSAPDDPVFFVTGPPRSGTTLVETILGRHPKVWAGGEMPFLNRALSPVIEALRTAQVDPNTFATAGERYLTAGRRRAGGDVFTDKTISTFSRIGHAAKILPQARFIVLRRDPRDVGLSIYRNMFREGRHRYSTDLTAIGHYIRLQDALIAFWATALPDRIKIVEYEALTADPEPIIRDMIAFCGLPWNDACLAPEKSDRRVQTLSFTQVRRPIGRQAVAGWRAFETELQPLIRALERKIDLTP